MKTKKQYFYNGLLLTAVALLMRTVSVTFNVYVSNLVGAEAMGLLSLISGVYGFAVTLATSGIHLATVRCISEHLEKSKGADNRRCLSACLSYALFFGLLSSLLLFLLARPVGLYLLKEPRSVRALRLLSFTLLPIALSSVMNGYFTAVRRAWKNAITQVTEQAVKISLTTYFLLAVTKKSTEGCVIAVLLGGSLAEGLSLILNFILYLFDKRHFKQLDTSPTKSRISVVGIALPVAISAYARSGLISVEHMLIPRGLAAFGLAHEQALASYGALQSMALPVVLYPAAILSSFAGLLIPEITQQQSSDNQKEIRYIAWRVFQATLLFSIGVGGIMLFLSGELGTVLYQSEQVSYFIKRLAPLVPIMYLDTATDAMLKGLGEQVYSMNVNIIDALISVLSVAIFVPLIGINGYLVTIYITELFNAVLSVCRLLRVSGFRPKVLRFVLSPILSVVGATSVCKIVFVFFGKILQGTPAALALHIALTALIYLFFLFLTGAFSREDRKWLYTSFVEVARPKKAKKSMISRKIGENLSQ